MLNVPQSPGEIDRLAQRFSSAAPFPHVVIDDVLTTPSLGEHFPDPAWPAWRSYPGHYQRGKRFCSDVAAIPEPLREIIRQMNEPRFLMFLEKVTGIDAIIPDPHLVGGGLHSSDAGGILAPHSDFHILDRLNLFRRLNVIIYLNDDWAEGDGGSLELYAKGAKTPAVKVVPTYGRMVIFRTDHDSVHGFSDPVAAGKRRDSLATYYYSACDSEQFGGDRRTYWRDHGKLGLAGTAQLAVHKLFSRTASMFARMAFAIDPQTGRLPRDHQIAETEKAMVPRDGIEPPTP